MLGSEPYLEMQSKIWGLLRLKFGAQIWLFYVFSLFNYRYLLKETEHDTFSQKRHWQLLQKIAYISHNFVNFGP